MLNVLDRTQQQEGLEPLIYELSVPGRRGVNLPDCDVPEAELPRELLRDELRLPELSELQVVRHFLKLSQLNMAIDKVFYPLGSCTMKYNPKLNEDMARLPGFAQLHPLTDGEASQGALALMYQLQQWLGEISGFEAVSLAPAAGAQGEFAGILMIRKYHLERGDFQRTKIIVPASAHGTNPATVSMVGFEVIEIPGDSNGDIELAALRRVCEEHGPQIAGMMITVPNTLGLFEAHILDVIDIVHGVGGLMYMDGANMNALMGVVKPGELGFDVMHYNLHKTFSTPHGGGGPGSGPVGVNAKLKPYLPGPVVDIVEPATDDDAPLYGLVMPEKSIGRLKAFQGNFGMHVRAYAYIRAYGAQGIRDVSRYAVLNANYVRAQLMDTYKIPYPRYCGHEFVIEARLDGAEDVHALDISKRLMDFGFHPPTNYFPLIVPEALLIEPTETEAKETLDEFIGVMKQIACEARENPQLLHSAPHNAPTKRLDEVRAAKQLVLCCRSALPQAGD
ncbi:MAG: aminomethyl-transferring glycine dehydrogenase subunit GcvPB [Anaerolineae bacterium]|nr:aminomethyl-transferring glycine dehydrogenase subunit GcvPB [Anaerolineae bacterium]